MTAVTRVRIASIRRRGQRGSALLLAMVILTLVASLAAAMMWQQYRAIQVEAAERARVQSAWILTGALDWARLILREDARTGGVDHLGEPWAVPLAEARLSTFLAAGRADAEPADDGLQAFLSGRISDVQARWGLRHLVDDEHKLVPAQLQVLQRLFAAAGAPADAAEQLAEKLRAAWADEPGALLAPETFADLRRFGLDDALLERLRPWIALLPRRMPLNLNTAPREVLGAMPGIDPAGAERLVGVRERTPFTSLAAAQKLLAPDTALDPAQVGIGSRYFEVEGRLRLDARVLEERSLVERRQLEVIPLARERVNRVAPG